MRKVCFLSMDNMTGYVADDDLAIAPLRDLGITVETLSWRQKVRSWAEFDLVVIRTTWDYQREPDKFLSVLDDISAAAELANPSSIARWNFNKSYLRELEQRGIAIVPTLWGEHYDEASFVGWKTRLSTDELIVKPTVSATAENTYRLAAFDPTIVDRLSGREIMVQPFVSSVVVEGEYSLFYFNGRYSHAIVKRPKPLDFRVQEEHGGIITETSADDGMRNIASRILAAIDEDLLYARIDLVRIDNGFAVMEVELIEPALYLRMNEPAPERFAAAIAERLGGIDRT